MDNNKNLICNQKFEYKGVILNFVDLCNLATRYQRGVLQEYIFENSTLTEEAALDVADKVLDIKDNYYEEDEVIKEAAKQLGYDRFDLGEAG